MKTIEVRSAGITDVGKLRTDNQDYFLVAELNRSMKIRSGAGRFDANSRLFGAPVAHVFVVADGMGGHRGGSEASSFASEFCANSILNSIRWRDLTDDSSDDGFVEDLKSMLEHAHRAIELQSQHNSVCAGMGTTLTLAYVAWPKMYVVHAGDTRCYLLRNGELQLVTRDHTVANEMIQKGQLSPADVERSQWSNVLVNALGAGATSVSPDIYKLDLNRNDSIMLCSDGLNKHVADFQIRKTLSQAANPQTACEELVSMAKQGGGTDNITVIIANFGTSSTRENRMPLILSRTSEELVLQDLDLPASELDTHDDETDFNTGSKDVESHSSLRDTWDFS